MDWVALITTIGGLLSGSGLMALRNWHANKRKAEADATGSAVDALNRAIDTLQEEREHDRTVIDKLTKEREALTNDKIALITRFGALKVCMCVHLGCIMRKPAQGQADKWMTDHAGEDLYGADYTTADVLFRRIKDEEK